MERDYDRYFNLMSKSMKEKIDFIMEDLKETIKYGEDSLIIDFGGANGELLSLLKNELYYHVSNKITYIIIEKQEVINIVEPGFKTDNIKFMTLEQFNTKYQNSDKYKYIIFSSILHELFSVDKPKKEDVFKTYIKPLLNQCKKIYIRDMYLSGSFEDLFYAIKTKAMTKYTPYYLENFGNQKVPTHEKLFEFLLKTRYLNHWDQEKKEYYFSINWKLLISQFANNGFITQYVNKYKNNHIITEIEERFQWENNLNGILKTHIKIIFSSFDLEV